MLNDFLRVGQQADVQRDARELAGAVDSRHDGGKHRKEKADRGSRVGNRNGDILARKLIQVFLEAFAGSPDGQDTRRSQDKTVNGLRVSANDQPTIVDTVGRGKNKGRHVYLNFSQVHAPILFFLDGYGHTGNGSSLFRKAVQSSLQSL